jgi:hypothetical protein
MPAVQAQQMHKWAGKDEQENQDAAQADAEGRQAIVDDRDSGAQGHQVPRL